MRKFLNKLLGKKSNLKVNTLANIGESKGIGDIGELQERVQTLQQKGLYRSALDEIFKALEIYPNKKDVLWIANLVIYLGQMPHAAYDAPEPLTQEYINDPRLDKIFCECHICSNWWVPNPLTLGSSGGLIHNPSGGRCVKCNRVSCINCAIPQNTVFACPTCKGKLEHITQPNGRASVQIPKTAEKLTRVVLLREGPVPPDQKFLTDFFQSVSPDVAKAIPNVKLDAFPVFPWPTTDEKVREKFLSLCTENQIPLTDNVKHYFIDSKDGTKHIFLAKFFI